MASKTKSSGEPAAVAAIVPHTKTKGIDICGDGDGTIYIIRSDLKCYMKCGLNLDFQPGYENQKHEIYPLHPACSDGDHYMFGPGGFNIIKGDYFITVNDLSVPTNIPILKKQLSPPFKGGENYLYDDTNNYYCIVKGDNYLVTSDLTATSAISTPCMYPSYKTGLFFYGTKGCVCIISQNDLGVMFTTTSDLAKSSTDWFVYPNVIDFLPGGLSLDFGTATPKWVILKSFTNSSEKSSVTWKETITKTVGFNKSHFQSLENSWSVNTEVSMGTSFEAGFLVKATITAQFKLSASFGGSSVQTEQEDWNEAYETTEEISITIDPGQSVYVWQFRMGLKGSEDVLFCRNLQLTSSPTAPSSIPLPPV